SRRWPSSPPPVGCSCSPRWPRCSPSASFPARSRGAGGPRLLPRSARRPTRRSGLLAPATYLRDETPELLVGSGLVLAAAIRRRARLGLGEPGAHVPARRGAPLPQPHQCLEHRRAGLGLLVRQVLAEGLHRLGLAHPPQLQRRPLSHRTLGVTELAHPAVHR